MPWSGLVSLSYLQPMQNTPGEQVSVDAVLQRGNEAPRQEEGGSDGRYKSEAVCVSVTGKGEGMLSRPRSFVRGTGTSGGYEAWGWRYSDRAAWHVRVWPEFEGMREKAFVVTDGVFEPDTPNLQQKVAVLSLIAQWEANAPYALSEPIT